MNPKLEPIMATLSTWKTIRQKEAVHEQRSAG